MKAKQRNGVVPKAPIINGGLQINLNTIVTSALGAFLIWQMTNALNTGKENNKSLTTVLTQLPVLDKSVTRVENSLTEVQKDVKEARSTMITRPEFTANHARLEASIKEVKDEQVKVRDELQKK